MPVAWLLGVNRARPDLWESRAGNWPGATRLRSSPRRTEP